MLGIGRITAMKDGGVVQSIQYQTPLEVASAPRMAEQSSGAMRWWWWWQLRNCTASFLLRCGGADCGRRRKGFVRVKTGSPNQK